LRSARGAGELPDSLPVRDSVRVRSGADCRAGAVALERFSDVRDVRVVLPFSRVVDCAPRVAALFLEAVPRVAEEVLGSVASVRPPVRELALRDPADRTVAASATREGRAEERELRSTSGRYKLTERLLTDARPGREALLISRIATRLRVTRSISLCRGPVTYVRLLYT